MSDIVLLGATYPDVPAVNLPKSGGGTATFYEADDGNNLEYGLTDGTQPIAGVAKADSAVLGE